MTEKGANGGKKTFDLEDRTKEFALRVREFVKKLPKTTGNFEDAKQLVRSSGSIAANYIEANEALSKKDFIMRIKISRKEAKESKLWLELVDVGNSELLDSERKVLVQEATELMMIMSAIMRKSQQGNTKPEYRNSNVASPPDLV